MAKEVKLTVGDEIYVVDKYFLEGAQASVDGKGDLQNPYRYGSSRHEQWNYGHNLCASGLIPLFDRKRDMRDMIRQTLMNDLGLSRESIRQEMNKIILESSDKHIAGSRFESLVQNIVKDEIRKEFPASKIREMIKAEISKSVQEYCSSILNVSVSVKDDTWFG